MTSVVMGSAVQRANMVFVSNWSLRYSVFMESILALRCTMAIFEVLLRALYTHLADIASVTSPYGVRSTYFPDSHKKIKQEQCTTSLIRPQPRRLFFGPGEPAYSLLRTQGLDFPLTLLSDYWLGLSCQSPSRVLPTHFHIFSD